MKWTRGIASRWCVRKSGCEWTEQVLGDELERLRGLELSCASALPPYASPWAIRNARHVEHPVELAGCYLHHPVLRFSYPRARRWMGAAHVEGMLPDANFRRGPCPPGKHHLPLQLVQHLFSRPDDIALRSLTRRAPLRLRRSNGLQARGDGRCGERLKEHNLEVGRDEDIARSVGVRGILEEPSAARQPRHAQ